MINQVVKIDYRAFVSEKNFRHFSRFRGHNTKFFLTNPGSPELKEKVKGKRSVRREGKEKPILAS